MNSNKQTQQLAKLKSTIEFALISKMSEEIKRGPSCLYIEPVTKKLIMKSGTNQSLTFGFNDNSVRNLKLIDFNSNGSIIGVYDSSLDKDFVEQYQDKLMIPYSQAVTRDMLHIEEDGTNIAIQGKRGPRGYSAFEWWARDKYGDEKIDNLLDPNNPDVELEYMWLKQQYMNAIRGEDGEDGEDGDDGDDGEDGEDGKDGAKKSIWDWLWGGVDFVEDVVSDGALGVLWGRVTAIEIALGINSAGDAAQSGMTLFSLF